MILVKVIVEGEEAFYVVDNMMEVYKKMASESTNVQSIEMVSNNVIIGLDVNLDDPGKFLERACKKFDVPLDKLRGTDRGERLASTRKVISFALKKKFNMTYVEIGDILHRDPTTVWHMAKEVESDIQIEGPLFSKLARVLNPNESNYYGGS